MWLKRLAHLKSVSFKTFLMDQKREILGPILIPITILFLILKRLNQYRPFVEKN